VPPDLIDRATGIGLFQDADDLGLGELRLPPGNLLAKGGYSARTFSLWLSTIAGSLQFPLELSSFLNATITPPLGKRLREETYTSWH
jgi:hypothetical protein